MPIDMSKHITLPRLVGFTLPTMGMMVFMAVYVMVDGFFVSNFCGATALAAVNFSYPIAMILGTAGFMLGTGGSALVAKTRGEGDERRANELFSMLVYVAIAAGVAFAIVGIIALRPILVALGAEGEMLELGVDYALIVVAGVPFTILQYLFQELLVTAGKPGLGFGVTFASGVTNIVLDALLIVGFGLGVRGAAVGTMLGEAVGGVIPLVYFARKNGSYLRLCRAPLDWRALGKACANGSSEMISNIAMSVVSIAYNVQLLLYLGELGVAAYGVIAYVGFAFAAVFLGYAVGSAPLMSYQHGARNTAEMRSLFKKGVAIVAMAGVIMFAATRVLAWPLAQVFVGYNESLMQLTTHAFELYSLAFLVMGLNVYGSALFTSLGNGLVSAAISFIRTLVCEVGAVFLLPLVLGPDGIWLSVVVAEAVALALTVALTVKLAPEYGYLSL